MKDKHFAFSERGVLEPGRTTIIGCYLLTKLIMAGTTRLTSVVAELLRLGNLSEFLVPTLGFYAPDLVPVGIALGQLARAELEETSVH